MKWHINKLGGFYKKCGKCEKDMSINDPDICSGCEEQAKRDYWFVEGTEKPEGYVEQLLDNSTKRV